MDDRRTSPARAAQPNPWIGMTALLLAFFLVVVNATSVSIAIPAILADLNRESG